jgi:hypothetical protein
METKELHHMLGARRQVLEQIEKAPTPRDAEIWTWELEDLDARIEKERAK